MNEPITHELAISSFLTHYKSINQSDNEVRIVDTKMFNQFSFSKKEADNIIEKSNPNTTSKLLEAIKKLLLCLHVHSDKPGWCNTCLEAFAVLKFELNLLEYLDFNKDSAPPKSGGESTYKNQKFKKEKDASEDETIRHTKINEKPEKVKEKLQRKRRSRSKTPKREKKKCKRNKRESSSRSYYRNDTSHSKSRRSCRSTSKEYRYSKNENKNIRLYYISCRKLRTRTHYFSGKDYWGSELIVNGHEVTAYNASKYFNILLLDYEWICNVFYSGEKNNLRIRHFNWRTTEMDNALRHPIFDEDLRSFFIACRTTPIDKIRDKVKKEHFLYEQTYK